MLGRSIEMFILLRQLVETIDEKEIVLLEKAQLARSTVWSNSTEKLFVIQATVKGRDPSKDHAPADNSSKFCAEFDNLKEYVNVACFFH